MTCKRKVTLATLSTVLLLLPSAAVALLPAKDAKIALRLRRVVHDVSKRRGITPFRGATSLPAASSADVSPQPDTCTKGARDLLASYAFHWEALLRREYQESVAELQQRRKSYTRSQLETSGLAIFNAVATPETELYGEKIVRVTLPQHATGDSGKKKLRDKFKRGDVLVMTPQKSFRGREVAPREGLVMDVGPDYITLGVGASWPAGVMEMRKHDNYRVRLDRSLSMVPLRAQRIALEKLRKGEAGSAAELLVQLFYDASHSEMASAMPMHFRDQGDLDTQIACAMKEATAETSFQPNPSQQEAVSWALQRTLGQIRGPPGTGKTRASALLIATALKMRIKNEQENDGEDGDTTQAPRILAVTHSNGAADVLLQAVLEMNVPAVRAGRPASVSPSVQHRTIAALSERMPEVVKLRQQAGDVTLESHVRQSAAYDAKQYLADTQAMIAKSAPVVVASCIGAQQLLSSMGEKDGGSAFPIVVLDEAAQTTEPALICALAAARASQVILVGDTRQLPPTVTTQDEELRKTIGVSPMERLLKMGIDEYVLKEQYRMPKSLLLHPNNYFYNGVVECASTGDVDPDSLPPDGFPWPSNEALAFVEVGNNSEVAHGFGGRSNPTEVDVVVDIIRNVVAAGDIEAKNIATISPYSKQVQLLRAELNNARHNDGSNNMSNVRVGTVDSFQGQETCLVVFSAVRSNPLKEMGFLRDARRLNVAITRARRGLIVVGDPSVLRSCRHWAALLDSCSDRGCTLTLSEYRSNKGDAAVAELSDDAPAINRM